MTDAERIAELEEEVAWLRGELGLSDADGLQVLRLRQTLRLEPAPARALYRLYRAQGESVTHAALLHVISPNPLDVDPAVAKVQIHYLRQSIGRECVASVWGVGYRLTAEGMDKVRQALGEQAESAAA